MNAHTWPDGTAMGNALLRELEVGDLIVVRGDRETRLCYEVTDEVEVPVNNLPAEFLDRVYDRAGNPQLVIIVCSGARLRPGTWTDRTLWFARPIRP